MVKILKNDRLQIEFNKLIDLYLKELKEQLKEHDKTKKQTNDRQAKISLKSDQIESHLHDLEIDLLNKYDKKFKKLSALAKLIEIKPRSYGFLLLVFGKKTLKITKDADAKSIKSDDS